MAIVGGFDIHRRQVTFDYLDTVTGQVRRGRIEPACRQVLRAWLGRVAGRGDVTFAGEGCTGWQVVVEELQRGGVTAVLAEPAPNPGLRRPQLRRGAGARRALRAFRGGGPRFLLLAPGGAARRRGGHRPLRGGQAPPGAPAPPGPADPALFVRTRRVRWYPCRSWPALLGGYPFNKVPPQAAATRR